MPGGVSVDIDEQLVSVVIDDWIDRGCVRLDVVRQNGKRAVRLAGGGLLGALAVQLVFELCRTDGLAICTSFVGRRICRRNVGQGVIRIRTAQTAASGQR